MSENPNMTPKASENPERRLVLYVAQQQQTQTQRTALHPRASLLGLPAELIIMIAEHLTDESRDLEIHFNRHEKALCALRQICKRLNQLTLEVFARQFFERMAIRLTIGDLNRLIAIAKHDYFGPRIRELRVCHTAVTAGNVESTAEVRHFEQGADAVLLSRAFGYLDLKRIEVEGVKPTHETEKFHDRGPATTLAKIVLSALSEHDHVPSNLHIGVGGSEPFLLARGCSIDLFDMQGASMNVFQYLAFLDLNLCLSPQTGFSTAKLEIFIRFLSSMRETLCWLGIGFDICCHRRTELFHRILLHMQFPKLRTFHLWSTVIEPTDQIGNDRAGSTVLSDFLERHPEPLILVLTNVDLQDCKWLDLLLCLGAHSRLRYLAIVRALQNGVEVSFSPDGRTNMWTNCLDPQAMSEKLQTLVDWLATLEDDDSSDTDSNISSVDISVDSNDSDGSSDASDSDNPAVLPSHGASHNWSQAYFDALDAELAAFLESDAKSGDDEDTP